MKENIADPYVVSADPSTPTGYIAEFNLIASDGSFSDTFAFNLVVGSYHYLVWNPDPTPAPGQRIDSILTSLGYTGIHETALSVADIDMFMAVFVCVGIFSNNYIIGASSSETSALVDYLNNGGNIYLEGGDVWYYDPLGSGYDFGLLFGIQAVSDGTGDLGPVVGESGTFTDQMNFNYAGENSYIDHINPTGSGFLIFRDGNNNYNCGVANDAGTYKTVGSSFELGGLVDGSGVSTRAVLLDSIMHFFGIFSTGIDEISDVNVKAPILKLYPNPFSKLMTISFGKVHGAKSIDLKIYDATGRLVKDFSRFTPDASRPTPVTWDGKDDSGHKVSSGIYFVTLETEDFRDTKKVIVVE